jgi:phage terminase small subunit
MGEVSEVTAGAKLRAAYDADFEPSTPADAVILDRACALLDAIEQMEARVQADDFVVIGGNGQPTSHPLIASIRAHTAEVARLVRQLGMEPESATTTRARRAANARWHREKSS